MKKKILYTGILGLLTVGLSGCDDKGSSSSSSTSTVTTQTPAFEDQFGTQFGVLYRAAANTDPANVNDGDVGAVSLTTEPVAVTGG